MIARARPAAASAPPRRASPPRARLVHLVGAARPVAHAVADATQVLLMPLLAARALVRDRRRRGAGSSPWPWSPSACRGSATAPPGWRAGTPRSSSWSASSCSRRSPTSRRSCRSAPAACCTCAGRCCWSTSPPSSALVAACVGGPPRCSCRCSSTARASARWPCSRPGVNRLTAVGGALFLVSDGLIALDAFVAGFGLPAQGFWVMATYLAAQVAHRRRRAAPRTARVHHHPRQTDAVRAR